MVFVIASLGVYGASSVRLYTFLGFMVCMGLINLVSLQSHSIDKSFGSFLFAFI